MDIALLSKIVKEIMLDNDELTLPGVGTFIAELIPSSFSDKGYTINPPYRRLSFRQHEAADSRLVDFYARSNGVDRDAATSIIVHFLAELKASLMQKKTIVFPGLGRLRATKENNFFFVPDEDLNIYPDGFGLEPISLKTHVETEDDFDAAASSIQLILNQDIPLETAPQDLTVREEVQEPVAPKTETQTETKAKEEAEAVSATIITVTEATTPAQPLLEKKAKKLHWAWILLISVVGALILFFGTFLLLSRIAPDFIDSLLYSAEELDLIRHFQ